MRISRLDLQNSTVVFIRQFISTLRSVGRQFEITCAYAMQACTCLLCKEVPERKPAHQGKKASCYKLHSCNLEQKWKLNSGRPGNSWKQTSSDAFPSEEPHSCPPFRYMACYLGLRLMTFPLEASYLKPAYTILFVRIDSVEVTMPMVILAFVHENRMTLFQKRQWQFTDDKANLQNLKAHQRLGDLEFPPPM